MNEFKGIVEVSHAFVWDCPLCGCENLCRGENVKEIDLENMSDARRALGLEEWEEVPEGMFIQIPDMARCSQCECVFKLTDPGE